MKRFAITIVMLFLCSFGSAQNAVHHRIVVDLTTVGSDGWAFTLSNVEHLKKDFKDSADIEVVVHGPAISMLHRDDTDFSSRINQLHSAGVRFVVGDHSIEPSGLARSQFFSFVEFVPSGIAEIVLKQEAGWSYLKGGY